MDEINELFPMTSEKATELAASVKQKLEMGKSNWISNTSIETLPYTHDNQAEEEDRASNSSHENDLGKTGKTEESHGHSILKDPPVSRTISINHDIDDYSYFNTIDFIKKTIHLLIPTTLILFVGVVLFLSGCLVALAWSHMVQIFMSLPIDSVTIGSNENGNSFTSFMSLSEFTSFTMINNTLGVDRTDTFSSETSSQNIHISNIPLKQNNDLVCAPWIPPEKRKIILRKHQRLNDWDNYLNGTGYLGGEGYWSASLVYILQSLDFEVILDNHNPYGTEEDIEQIRNGKVHRVIVDSYFNKDEVTDKLQNNPESMCHVRFFEWWDRPNEELENTYGDARKVLSPYSYPENSSTTIPFFVHSEITLSPLPTDRRSRGRKALLLDKNCAFSQNLLNGLFEAGYELHLTCFKSDAIEKINSMVHDQYQSQLYQYSQTTPKEFAKLLRKVSVVVGFGNPRDSPTPLEGLANGAAFLNPTSENEEYAQHAVLKTLGPPYVYNYVRSPDENVTLKNILEMAEMAMNHPFGSYIPFQYRYNVVREQVCSNLIEPDNICECLDMNQELYKSNNGSKINFCRGKF